MSQKIGNLTRGFALRKVVLASVLLLIALGVVGVTRKKSLKPEEAPEVETQIRPTEALNQTVTSPAPAPSPSPSPSLPATPPPKGTYQVNISESELNFYLTQGLTGLPQSGDNPITEVKITLHEGFGIIEANWKKEQRITAQIHLTPDAKDLTIENLEVTGAGLLTGLFEQIATEALTSVLDSFLASQRELLERIEIKTGEVILYYRLL